MNSNKIFLLVVPFIFPIFRYKGNQNGQVVQDNLVEVINLGSMIPNITMFVAKLLYICITTVIRLPLPHHSLQTTTVSVGANRDNAPPFPKVRRNRVRLICFQLYQMLARVDRDSRLSRVQRYFHSSNPTFLYYVPLQENLDITPTKVMTPYKNLGSHLQGT